MRFEGNPLEQALRDVAAKADLSLTYSDVILPKQRTVWLTADRIRADEALEKILGDAGLQLLPLSNGRLVVVPASDGKATATAAIRGEVTDSATGAPLASAQVRVIGTGLSAMTNDSGSYRIEAVPSGTQRLQAIRIGYTPQTRELTVPDSGEVSLDFVLAARITVLDELVTTVTGDQRRLEVGNSIASIEADSLLQSAPVMSFGDLIQGRGPGVLSMTTGPNAGQAGGIRIRGLNSFGVPNDPIVVVDGVRVEASAGQGFGGGSPTASVSNTGSPSGGLTGRLADFDPDEIASVAAGCSTPGTRSPRSSSSARPTWCAKCPACRSSRAAPAR